MVEWVRQIISELNVSGFESLKPRPASGCRPRILDDEIRLEIVNMALTPPQRPDYPFTQWLLEEAGESTHRGGNSCGHKRLQLSEGTDFRGAVLPGSVHMEGQQRSATCLDLETV
jgi:hypothetical protein